MNDMVVTLLATKPCELNNFLSAYYNKDMEIQDGSFRWSGIFKNPIEGVCILATLMDNIENYKIEALVSINHYDNFKVSKDNVNDLVKFLYWINS